MKLHNLLLSTLAVAFAGSCFTACSDDDMFTRDGKEAFIIGTDNTNCLYVIGASGARYNSRMSNDTIYIKVNPLVDVETELCNCVPKFYISKGSTVTPDPTIAQDFSVEGGVKYTVTSEDRKTSKTYVVTHGLTDHLPYGEGYTYGSIVYNKTFPELGYPGERGNFGFADSREYGDINGYIAFCGHDHFVILGRQYSDPRFDSGAGTPDFDLGIRVYNVADGSYAGALNTGSINRQMIRAITSDWQGKMVAIVPQPGGASTDIFMWAKPTDEPKLVANVAYNLSPNLDGSNYVQVAGSIDGTANMTCLAPRSKDGEHYWIRIEGGQVTDVKKVKSGYASDDCTAAQMISPMSDEADCDYVIGDTEGAGNSNNCVKVYINNHAGRTKLVMPALLQNIWEMWWVGTGSSLARTGGRRPVVSGMMINGKSYTMILNGTGWWWHNDIADSSDLQTRAHLGTEVRFSINAAWSFGASGDWYWDDATKEAYWLSWVDRDGMYLVKMTCYE